MQDNCKDNIIHEEIVDKVQSQMLDDTLFEKSALFFKLMGNKTRFQILWALDKSELCVCDLAYLLSMTKSAISHQLALLRDAKLVRYRKEGKNVYYSIADFHVHLMLESCKEHAEEEFD